MLKNTIFYSLVIILVFGGQFLMTRGIVTGTPPVIQQTLLDGSQPMTRLAKGPALLYFWADWCGVCRSMQGNVGLVLPDYPLVTVALRSGDAAAVQQYLASRQLTWPVVNDAEGGIAGQYGVQSVPALLFLNRQGQIVFSTVGYTSEWGIRVRLWLASWV